MDGIKLTNVRATTDQSTTDRRRLEERIRLLERQLAERDNIIQEMTSQLDKYRSVLPAATAVGSFHHLPFQLSSAGSNGRPTSVTDATNTHRKLRTVGVSAEPYPLLSRDLESLEPGSLKIVPKSQHSIDVIKQAIQSNDFMKHLSPEQINQIVDCMYPVEYKKDTVIIREGDVGSRVYVLEEGRVDVFKNAVKLSTRGPNIVLGELAILYNCKRTATVKALDYCKLWTIDRHVFQTTMLRSEILKQRQYTDWLKRVPKLQNSTNDVLLKLLESMEQVPYKQGETIIKQGTKNDCLYIVCKGKVKETRRHSGLIKDDTALRFLVAGDYFGENSLEAQEVKTTGFIAADATGVICIQLDRVSYNQVINKAHSELTTTPCGNQSPARVVTPTTSPHAGGDSRLPGNNKGNSNSTDPTTVTFDPLNNVRQFSDLTIITTLGVGGFGRVELVRVRGDMSGKTYALKQMKKCHIVETCQQEHIMNEKNIMSEMKSDFIVRLHKSFKDAKYLYLVMDVCLGGELWTLLRDRSLFDEATTRFYCACVSEAFAYLHIRSIVYRDLKPENLLIDLNGYIKLVDFGFAKKVGCARKTWTFCGTPEYVAPEIILNKGHDMSADLWSLGILTFELLTGSPPFTNQDPMKTYGMILKGISAVDMPRQIGKSAASFIRKLCKTDPSERLGYGPNGMRELHKHKWFDTFSWDALRRRTYKAPYIPKVKGNADTSNFDSYPDDEAGVPPDDNTGWDKDF